MAYADVVMRRFQVCQFVDTPNLVNLESVTVQLRAKECLLVSATENDTKATMLKQLMERSGLTITERKKGYIACTDGSFYFIIHPTS